MYDVLPFHFYLYNVLPFHFYLYRSCTDTDNTEPARYRMYRTEDKPAAKGAAKGLPMGVPREHAILLESEWDEVESIQKMP